MSGFVEWSRQAGTKPFRWPERKPVARISVRLMPAFFGQHIVNIRPGDAHATIALNRSDIWFPEAFDEGHPTPACRNFITESVRQAVRRDHHKRCINWSNGSSTLFTEGSLTPILRRIGVQ